MSIPGADGSRRPAWFRSSYSNGAGGECIECALTTNEALLRDSKCQADLVITVSSGAWRAFLAGVLEHGRLAP